MLTAAVAALLVCVVLIIASIVVSAWLAHRRYKRTVASQSTLPAHPLDRHVTAILHLQDGNIVRVEEPGPPSFFILPARWYARRRIIVSLGLLAMLLLAMAIQGGLAGGGGIRTLTDTLGLSFLNPAQPNGVSLADRPLPTTASQRVVRIDSASVAQYRTAYQLNVWSYSSCSGIAMETVMNAYGRHFIASDILQEELNLGVWDVNLGLLREDGIGLTAANFGFATDAGHTRTFQQVVDIANKGQPVIVSVRDARYYPGGHLFVIKGGDDQYVYIADSSLNNFQKMTNAMFQGMWQGFSAVLTPKDI
ncbi:C39 family peptidase [Tengunoibacter tsumagoiensis]|uniref:Peptidase C39-like domain-containing protein n=1 Tax=Tengunoibacter tsumagoiensis TaxID=2014871 RepID=A0A402A1I6_9CHLR|nr:C39 family peptidase [Tengunoibacter tsumagoiensis]GCE12984.1 hypothetical protein KTT_28430 [Tengunoibacter tsumagoiensis]